MTRQQALRKLNTLNGLFQTKRGDDEREAWRIAKQAGHVYKYALSVGPSLGYPKAGELVSAVQRVQAATGELVMVAEGQEFNPEIIEQGRVALAEAQALLQE